MKKVCTKCNKEKSLDDFAFKSKEKNTRKACCRTCVSENDKSRYYADLPAFRAKRNSEVKLRRQRNMKVVVEYLKKHPCVDCKEKNFMCLDFDHRNQKTKIDIIANMVKNSSIERIKEEINKCDVRCANCHRIKTAKQLGWYKYL